MKGLWLICICTGLVFTGYGCKDDPESTPIPIEKETNEWIYKQMSGQYLYNTHTKSVTPDYGQDPEVFFESLLSASPNNNDGKHYDPDNSYFYSYLEHTDETTPATGYGFEYAHYGDSPGYARILYVVAGSSAARAGLIRSMWIEKINGMPVSKNTLALVKNGSGVTLRVGEASGMGNDGLIWKSGSPYAVTLPAAGSIAESPVRLALRPANLGVSQVGYLLYNKFDTGPGGFDDKTYDNELKNAFRQFKSAGVRDLIVDLRYNPGGYLECCRLLASMIAPQSALGKLFAVSRYNEDLMASQGETKTYLMTLSEISDCNLNLSRVCVLTGQGTASSSELLINGLRPYMDVYQIGVRTEGKNVGGHTITSNAFKIRLHPVTVQIYNSLNESDYKNGFVPDLTIDELNYGNLSPLFPLGDTDEWLLADAIAWLQGAPMPYFTKNTRTTSIYPSDKITTSIRQRLPGGVILTGPPPAAD